ncbi:MAG: SLC13 family permease [Ilumatobacteraceae bacterium]
MTEALDQVSAMVPALLFLCVGVPLASLLDRLGYFEAVASSMQQRAGAIRVGALWALACATTAVLNLDTTVVLLTPLYIRLAKRSGIDPFPLALIPLFTASFASSFLPVSNLTTLIAVERLDLSVSDVVTYLALPSLVACVVGWSMFRRTAPTTVPAAASRRVDRRALTIGSLVVAGLLAGFVFGGLLDIEPWMVALVADVVLVVVTRSLPWRDVPIVTALAVAGVALLAALIIPSSATEGLTTIDAPLAVAATVGVAAVAANIVNNLPATLLGLEGVDQATWGFWGWLLGVNVGAALLPIGALANLLWWRIARAEGVEVGLGRYVRATVPIVMAALVASAACLGVLAALGG